MRASTRCLIDDAVQGAAVLDDCFGRRSVALETHKDQEDMDL